MSEVIRQHVTASAAHPSPSRLHSPHICRPISYLAETITCTLWPRSLLHLGRNCPLAWHASGITAG